MFTKFGLLRGLARVLLRMPSASLAQIHTTRMRCLLVGLLCLVLWPMHALAQVVGEQTFRVDCDKGETISKALDRARDGATIEVSGTCTEQVFVDKDRVEIVGIGLPAVIGPPNSFGTFSVRGTGVLIRGFTLRGETGVSINSGGSAEIRSNVIDEVTNTGIIVAFGSFGDIHHNDVRGGHGEFSLIFLHQSASAEIRNNTVTNSDGSGIGIDAGSSAQIFGNTVSGSTFGGIVVLENSYAFLTGGGPNTLEDNLQGVVCDFSSVIRVDVAQIFIGNGQDLLLGSCEVRNFVGVPFP